MFLQIKTPFLLGRPCWAKFPPHYVFITDFLQNHVYILGILLLAFG